MKQEIKQRWIGLRYWQRLGLKFSLLGIIVTGVFWKARPESLLSWILSLITRPALRLAEFLGDLGMYNF
ncbi:MAG: hypothetical protein KKF00_14485, partial [Proteobacteria bacterium]|nr:hypothetical protein [Pseudomonadota bacterium]